MNGNKGWRQGFVEGYGILNPQQPTQFAGGGEVDKYLKELQAKRAATPDPTALQEYITSLNNRRVPSFQNIAARGRIGAGGTPTPWAKAKDFPYTGPVGGGGGGGGAAGVLGALGGLGGLIAKNPALAKEIYGKLFGFDPTKFATSEEAQAATDQLATRLAQTQQNAADVQDTLDKYETTNKDNIQKYADAEAQRLGNMDLGGAAAGAIAGAIPPFDSSLAGDVGGKYLVGTQEIDPVTGEWGETDFGPSGSRSEPEPEPEPEPSQPEPSQPEPSQPASPSSSGIGAGAAAGAGVLPSITDMFGATSSAAREAVQFVTNPVTGMQEVIFTANPSASLVQGASPAISAGAGSAASGLSPDVAARLSGVNRTIQESNDMLAEVMDAQGAAANTAKLSGTGSAFADAGLSALGSHLVTKLVADSPEGQIGGALGSLGMGLAANAGLLGSGVSWMAGPAGALIGAIAGQMFAEDRPPLLNPITNTYVQPGSDEYGAVAEYYQRNVNVPEHLTSYDYSTEDQARLATMMDAAASDPSSFDPNAVSNLTTAATGVTYNPMSFEELSQKLGYQGTPAPKIYQANQTQPATTAQPATTQPQAIAPDARRVAGPTPYNPQPAAQPVQPVAQPTEPALMQPSAADYYAQYYDPNDPNNPYNQMYFMAEGGEVPDTGSSDLAPHEYSAGGKFLRGDGDGMSDDIVANIDGTQEARLADGEFVIPADVVSHLGNGSSEAGSRVLYAMMDRVRKARTGNTKQGKQIDPDDHVPA